jgi:hypothetical protein
MRTLVVLLAIASTARAEPPAGEIHDSDEPAEPAEPLAAGAADTFLHLDADLRLTVDNLHSKIAREERSFQLGPRARVALQSEWRVVDHEIPLRGWRAAASGTYELGGLTLSATVGVEQVDTDIGRHGLATAGIAVGRNFRVGRKVRAWLGLAAGHRRWLGEPPPGEANATQVMLSLKLRY